ncbi:hypothetical protein ACSSS7_002899 [Eimeria intestinalis]
MLLLTLVLPDALLLLLLPLLQLRSSLTALPESCAFAAVAAQCRSSSRSSTSDSDDGSSSISSRSSSRSGTSAESQVQRATASSLSHSTKGKRNYEGTAGDDFRCCCLELSTLNLAASETSAGSATPSLAEKAPATKALLSPTAADPPPAGRCILHADARVERSMVPTSSIVDPLFLCDATAGGCAAAGSVEFLSVSFACSFEGEAFRPVWFDVSLPPPLLLHAVQQHASCPWLLQRRQELYGPSNLHVECRSLGSLFAAEVLQPFYLCQLLAILLWLADGYYCYAIVIAIITAAATASCPCCCCPLLVSAAAALFVTAIAAFSPPLLASGAEARLGGLFALAAAALLLQEPDAAAEEGGGDGFAGDSSAARVVQQKHQLRPQLQQQRLHEENGVGTEDHLIQRAHQWRFAAAATRHACAVRFAATSWKREASAPCTSFAQQEELYQRLLAPHVLLSSVSLIAAATAVAVAGVTAYGFRGDGSAVVHGRSSSGSIASSSRPSHWKQKYCRRPHQERRFRLSSLTNALAFSLVASSYLALLLGRESGAVVPQSRCPSCFTLPPSPLWQPPTLRSPSTPVEFR